VSKEIKFIIVLFFAINILLGVTLYEANLMGASTVPLIVISSIIGVVIFILCNYIYNIKKITTNKAFFIVIPLIFIMFFVSMPIFKNHDEDNHWLRIYDIAQGNILVSTEYGSLFQEGATNYPAAKFPKAVHSIVDREKTSRHNFNELYQYEINKEDSILVEMPTVAIYSPVQYLPQVVGVKIAEIFTNRPVIMAYAARLANMITSIAILYYAMKIMPFGKKILLVIMSIPIAVEGFTSLSPDALTISIAILLIAYVFNIIYNPEKKKVTTKDKIILGIICIIMALCKIVYLPLVGLLILLPTTKFKTKKDKVITITLLILIATIINLGWLYVSSQYLADYKAGAPVEQLKTIINNPIRFFKMIFHTINLNGNNYIISMFGGSLGLNEHVLLNCITPYVFLFLCLMLGVADDEIKEKMSKFQRNIIILIILAITILIFTSLYIQWNSPDATNIDGIQGRYFIPFLPLVILLMGKLKIKAEYKEESIIKFISITILLTQINVIISILSRNLL